MKKTKTIVEAVCDYCEGDYRVKHCNVCNAEICGNHYMHLYEHDYHDRPCNTFIVCFKCIAPEIMKPFVEVKRNNSGNPKWGERWVS